jgi:cbb3-type cytochrome oxidase subunit 3
MDPVLSLTDFANIKAICAGIGLVIFGTVFVVAVVWVYRPGARTHYQNIAKKLLED